MARKGRDLFEVLRERSSSGGRPAADKRPAGRSAARKTAGGRSPGGSPPGGTAAELGRGIVDWMKRSVGAAPAAAPPPPIPQGAGLVLVIVAAVALLLGFLVGRVTTGYPAEAGELRRSGVGLSVAAIPGWVRQGDEVSRDPIEAEKRLSDLGFLLLGYPALHGPEDAAAAAVWLRSQGLKQTRTRMVKHRDSGEHWYVVICYSDPARAADDEARLRALQAPDFLPKLRTALANLRPLTDVTFGDG